MKTKLEEIVARLDEIRKAAESEGRELTDGEQREVERLQAQYDVLYEAYNEQRERERLEQTDVQVRTRAITPIDETPAPRAGRVLNCPDERTAYRFGQFVFATSGNERAQRYCRDNGIELRTMTIGTGSAGGYLVPTEFLPVIVDNRVKYGVFRNITRVQPMTRDVMNIPRVTAGATGYWVSEASAITASDPTLAQIQLSAKKLGAIIVASSELAEDAAVDLGDWIAGEMARALAAKEDDAAFNGDGSGTYGGITGVVNALGAGSIVNAASGSATDWSKITLADFTKMVGKARDVAGAQPVWVASKPFVHGVMEALAYAAGGNSVVTLARGMERQFLGYPVYTSDVLPKTATTAEVVCIFGDFTLATVLGDRRELTLARATEGYIGTTSLFASDLVAYRATERIDINVFDAGDASNAGLLVGLKTAV